MVRCCFPTAQKKKIHPKPTNEPPQKDNPVTHPKSSEKYKVSPTPKNHPMSTFDTKDPQARLNIHIANYLMNTETTEDKKKYLIKEAMINYLKNLNISDDKKIKKIQNTYKFHENQLVTKVAQSITEKDLSSNPT